VRTATTNNACKFHEDRLYDGVTIYFIVVKPRAAMELGPVFATGVTIGPCGGPLAMQPIDPPDLARRIMSTAAERAARVWRAVRSVYGQPKSKKREYISGIAAMSAGQILVFCKFTKN